MNFKETQWKYWKRRIWECCGNQWDLLLTKKFPNRLGFHPVCPDCGGTVKIIKVGIVGSRRRNSPKDKAIIKKALMMMLESGKHLHLVSGGCPLGADRFAEELSEELILSISIHYPNKDQLPENPVYYDYVKMYHDRNTLIAEECDFLIALPAEDRSGGTEDTIKKTDKLGKGVICL